MGWSGKETSSPIQMFTFQQKEGQAPGLPLPSFTPPSDELPEGSGLHCVAARSPGPLQSWPASKEQHCCWPCPELGGKGPALGGEAGSGAKLLASQSYCLVLAHVPEIYKPHSPIPILLLIKIFGP